MDSQTISISEAKPDKLFYVVATIVIINPGDATCLLLKRSDREKVHPGKWAFPGGKLEHGDIARLLAETGNKPIDGIDDILGILAARETKEECGLTVNVETSTIIDNKVFIRPDGIPVFLAYLATEYSSGSVVLEDSAFNAFAWVSLDRLDDYDCIDDVHQKAALALSPGFFKG